MILIGAAAVIPETVMVFDVATVLRATFVWAVKENGSGAVLDLVVTLNIPSKSPIVRIAFVVVE